MKKMLAILLIAIGIMFLLTPVTMNQIVKHHNKIIMDEELFNKPSSTQDQSGGEFDYSAVTDLDIMSLIEGSRKLDTSLIIGTISIPDLDINLPIMKGLNNSNLLVGAATMKEDQAFGLGNYTLSGHNMKNKDLLFGSLMDIQIASMVYISDGEKIYEYKVYETIVVPDTAMEMLSDDRSYERGRPIISLMTCYHSSRTGKRFFALAELVDSLN